METVVLAVIAVAAWTFVLVTAPSVIADWRADRRLKRAVRNFQIQTAQIADLMAQFGVAADHAAEVMAEFASAWDSVVVESASAVGGNREEGSL